MTQGVIYWISGTKLILRLYVSLASLREVYDGDVTVIVNNDVPKEFETDFLNQHGFSTIRVEAEVGHKQALLMKCLSHMLTPYDLTVFIDCDTLILKSFCEMFDWAEEHDFVATQFHNWPSSIHTRPRNIGKRIKQWGPEEKKLIDKKTMDEAYEYGHGINVGVFSFKGRYEDDNYPSIYNDWHGLAKKGIDTFIPDELACQILLPRHKHYLAPKEFNSSCKFDNVTDDTRIIHYHGRKHANTEKTKGTTDSNGKTTADLWIDKMKELHKTDWCNFKELRSKWNDRHSRWIKL